MEVYKLCIQSMVSPLYPFFQQFWSYFTGGKDLEEIELLHLDGHKGSRPVRCVFVHFIGKRTEDCRIGNGAADHLQLVSFTSCLTVYGVEALKGHLR